jgi:uncharacterized protein YmfQ (DUF2313 family)
MCDRVGLRVQSKSFTVAKERSPHQSVEQLTRTEQFHSLSTTAHTATDIRQEKFTHQQWLIA